MSALNSMIPYGLKIWRAITSFKVPHAHKLANIGVSEAPSITVIAWSTDKHKRGRALFWYFRVAYV